MAKQQRLTDTQQHTIMHAIGVAAERYKEHADDAALDKRLRDQFARQVGEARDLIMLLADAPAVNLVGADASDGEGPSDDTYIARARERYEREGEIEIDEDAAVSRGDDPGAYVQGWLWVAYDADEEG